MKAKLLFTTACAAALCAMSAHAGSLSTGFYGGLNIGYDIGDTDSFVVTTLAGTYFNPPDDVDIAAAGPFNVNNDGINGGAQFGYNWMHGIFGLGIETDFNYMGRNNTESVTAGYSCCAPTTFTTALSVDRDWLATVRARLGVDIGGAFLYGTGGVAFGDVGLALTFSDTFNPLAPSTFVIDSTEVGWTVGGGLETMFAPNLSAKVEYLYVDLGTQGVVGLVGPVPDDPLLGAVDFKQHVARLGINLHF